MHTPNNLVFVQVDFGKQSFENELAGSGYKPSAKTIFIMEGVT
jgi:O-methyltransferase involved in polyketide biosynthesis